MLWLSDLSTTVFYFKPVIHQTDPEKSGYVQIYVRGVAGSNLRAKSYEFCLDKSS